MFDIPSKYNRLTGNTIWLSIMTIGKYLLPLITLPYLTRILTPHYYGIVTYLTSTMTYFQVIVDYGFIFSSTKDVSLNINDKNRLGEILSETIEAKFFLTFLSFIILSLIIPTVEILRENCFLTILYFVSVIVTIFLPDFIYRGIEKMSIVSGRFLIARLISTVLTFIVIKSPDDILLLPILLIAGNLGAIIFSYYHLFKKEKVTFKKVTWNNIILSFKRSSVYFVGTFATTAFGVTTTFLLGVERIDVSLIACWGLSYQLISSIQMLWDPLVSSLYPYMIKEKDFKLLRNIILKFMPVVAIGICVCFFLAGTIIRIIAGEGYNDAILVFRILLPILILSFPAQLLGFPLLAPINKERYVIISTIIAAVFQVLGLLILMAIDSLTIINVAILRVITDLVLLTCRIIIMRAIPSYAYIK